MKKLLFLLPMCLLLLVGCKHEIPTPAIKFYEGIPEMQEKQTGKLVESHIATEECHPFSVGYRLNDKMFKYVVNSDTIVYWFIRDQLFAVITQMPNTSLNELKQGISQSYRSDDEDLGFYCSDDFFVKIGKEKNGSYATYFNPTRELNFHIECIKKECIQHTDPREDTRTALKTCTGENFCVRMNLMLAGGAAVTGPIDYYSRMLFLIDE